MFTAFERTIPGLGQYHVAGLPGYERNFSRDGILAGILAIDYDISLLAMQQRISAAFQGQGFNVLSGEEPGKIHHEYPGVSIDDSEYVTTYNACDTTALYLIAEELLRGKGIEVASSSSLESAANYVMRHSAQRLFVEHVPPGAERYALKVTYWKDSILPRTGDKPSPAYPVSYGLAHFMAARGLLAAGRLLECGDYANHAHKMFSEGIKTFMQPQQYVVFQDTDGSFGQASSDELHALAYIPAQYKMALPIGHILERSRLLETCAGYACTPQKIGNALSDPYHGYKVWIFEQAFIYMGSQKFSLDKVADVARKCIPHIANGQELVGFEDGSVAPEGNERQLWSVAAAGYFKRHLQPPI